MPEDSLLVGVDRSVVEFFVPFSAERLDSILSVGLPGLDYRVRPFVASDTLSGQSLALWLPLSKNCFQPLSRYAMCRPDRAKGGVGGCGSSHEFRYWAGLGWQLS